MKSFYHWIIVFLLSCKPSVSEISENRVKIENILDRCTYQNNYCKLYLDDLVHAQRFLAFHEDTLFIDGGLLTKTDALYLLESNSEFLYRKEIIDSSYTKYLYLNGPNFNFMISIYSNFDDTNDIDDALMENHLGEMVVFDNIINLNSQAKLEEIEKLFSYFEGYKPLNINGDSLVILLGIQIDSVLQYNSDTTNQE